MVEDLKTKEQRVAYLIEQVPAAKSNYKLLLLLYWQIFDGIEIPSEVVNAILSKGTEPESIGRLRRMAVSGRQAYDEIVRQINEAINGGMDNEGSNQSNNQT